MSIKKITSLRDLKKIGFIVPSSNTALEPLTVAMASSIANRVSFHFSRVVVRRLDTDSNSIGQFNNDKMVASAVLLGDADLDALLWNGTSGSWSGQGLQADVILSEEMQAATGLPSSTSTLAQIEVLKEYGIKRFAMAGPYADGPTQGLVKFYNDLGYEVVKTSQMDETANVAFGNTAVERLKELVRAADSPDAECIVVACTNWPVALVIDEMEAELGKPIFDSICVTLWKALRMVDVNLPIFGWGQLLRDDPVVIDINAELKRLLDATGASRTTFRLDLPAKNCHSDMVTGEATAPGVAPLKLDPSLNQRALKTVQWLETSHQLLIQPDCVNAPIPPPKALMSVYGVKAQMLAPLYRDDVLTAWISIHYIPSTREWTEKESTELEHSLEVVDTLLTKAGWL
ncbi:Asp/Glu/Hydantoin racemase-domain-containing protein [Limtongia smithiae]|uniref:Asp/Glu/Hydantoin racemase-domain-containing protein n=1 Tax=Limtongia smithiae TaxID=1125753 RepID=UPI0034CD1BC1